MGGKFCSRVRINNESERKGEVVKAQKKTKKRKWIKLCTQLKKTEQRNSLTKTRPLSKKKNRVEKNKQAYPNDWKLGKILQINSNW